MTAWNIPVSGARIRKLARATTRVEAQKIQDRGYHQAVSTAEGLREMVAWYQSEKQHR